MHKSALVLLAAAASVAASATIRLSSLHVRSLFPRQRDFGPCNSDCQPFSVALDAVQKVTLHSSRVSAQLPTPATFNPASIALSVSRGGDRDLIDAGRDLANTYNDACLGVNGVPTVTVGGTGSGPTVTATSPVTTPRSTPTTTIGRTNPTGLDPSTVTVTAGGPAATGLIGAGMKLSAGGAAQVMGFLLPALFLAAL